MFPVRAATAWAAFVVVSLVLAQPLSAATVSGQVRSRDGARLPYARVTVMDVASGATWRTVTGELGTFAVTGLPPGRYEVHVDADGFSSASVPAVDLVSAETSVSVEPVLDVASIREAVTVMGGAPRGSLEPAALRAVGARDVGESLTATAGVWQLRKGGIANEIVVRGLQSRDLNVLIDGQRTYGACPNHMDPPAFHVDFAEVERVDVEQGPFDVRHQGSLGGLVNVVTRQPGTGWHGSLTFGAGAGGYVNPAGTVSYGTARASILVGVSFRRATPYRAGDGRRFTELTNYATQERDSEAFRVASGWGRAAVRLGPAGRLQASYTRQRADHVFYPYLQMDGIWDITDRLSVRLDGTPAGWLDAWQAQVYFTNVDHWMTDEYRTSSTGMPRSYSMGTDASTRTTGGRVEGSARAVTAGLELVRREWTSRTLLAGRQYAAQASLPDVVFDTAGAFADWRRVLGSRVTLEIGARLDHVDSRADGALANTTLYQAYHGTRRTSRRDLLPAAKAKLTGQAGPLQLSLAAGHTARVAEANERFFAMQRVGSDWVGNPDLRPVRNTGVEAGVVWMRAGATVTTQAYSYRVDDYIAVYDQVRRDALPGIMNVRARSYANIDARLTGLDVSASVPLGSKVFASGDLSYVRGTQNADAARGIRASALAEMPALRARARLRFDDGRWFAAVEQVVTGDQRRVDADLGEAPTPGAAFTNLSAGVRWRQLHVTMGVSNVFNRRYVDALAYQRDPFRTGLKLPEPGRQWFSNFSLRF
jgi:iron complex outermembrane receptor protein